LADEVGRTGSVRHGGAGRSRTTIGVVTSVHFAEINWIRL